ncbi:non-oxidative hydroxyarylic acid decarboxylases subunit D [Streptomyces globisporus]|uniref:non-oxidative hydroxyarylic acid decarboxylases subunit D n=1 Tax=Streptomyces globisporus TaxID=1908 RepID=UPI0004CB6012|nr:non-oxidative hydroxyarylic acid decarboxylases subunit D [Streptomyces globisporus]
MPSPSCCPRCRDQSPQLISVSPVPGCWTVHACRVCLYSWRSTEPSQVTDADLYPAAFRIESDDIPSFPVMPPVPDLRGPTPSQEP